MSYSSEVIEIAANEAATDYQFGRAASSAGLLPGVSLTSSAGRAVVSSLRSQILAENQDHPACKEAGRRAAAAADQAAILTALRQGDRERAAALMESSAHWSVRALDSWAHKIALEEAAAFSSAAASRRNAPDRQA